ncbi:MAG: hypothetical protein GQ546_03695 [Gammaproteobacteria bacterium]|nr:hypothetical protein [Gammaproteobacteria bacterium]
MKALKLLLTSALFTSVMITGIAQAEPRSDNDLYDIIHPESADLFHFDDSLRSSEPTEIKSYSDVNGDVVWSFEYEEYVNASDFEADDSIHSAQGINRYMSSNPTAAGKPSEEVFKYDTTYGGFMLQ